MRNILIDAILFALFIAELSFHHLPKILHEILGVAMLAAIIIHVGINFRRFVALFKKITPRKIFIVAVNVGLTIGAAVVLFSGVCMSNHLFPDVASFELRRNMTLHQLHTATPYIMMILIGMHIGLHWQELRQRFIKLCGLENFYQRWEKFLRVTVVILAVVGALGLFLNSFHSRILMKHIFATPATDLVAPLFMLLMLGGVIFFALITSLIDKCYLLAKKK